MGIHVIVGGQYGSEAKGHVTDQVIRRLQRESAVPIFNIRVGGPNAGHTVYDGEGNKFPLRQVPVGATRGVNVLIGPGSEIELQVLHDELTMLREAGHNPRLYVHSEATMLMKMHKDAETQADLHVKIGSTGKGIGAARAARIMRTAKTVRQSPDVLAWMDNQRISVLYPADWTKMVNHQARVGHLVIEGVQGYGLGLHAGYYPQSTTSDSTAVDFLSAAGVSPWVDEDGLQVYVVAREFPIRVAGNSGPMFEERTWAELGLEPERTTVTHKVRRVGRWDPALIHRAVAANGGSPHAVVVLTMVDQRFPYLREFQSADYRDAEEQIGAHHPVWQHIKNVERDAGTTVVGFTTSPTTIAWL